MGPEAEGQGRRSRGGVTLDAQACLLAAGDGRRAGGPKAWAVVKDHGTWVPTLNGATNPAPLEKYWEPRRPWSPIVGIERSDLGIDWYVHGDGSRSTTEMRWRQDLDRMDALVRTAHPGPATTPALGPGPRRQ